MRSSIVAHGVLALCGVVLAYAAWAAPKGGHGPDTVVMVAGRADKLKSVVWEEANYRVTLEPVADRNPRVTVEKLRVKEGGEKDIETTKMYPGSPRAQETLEKMAPFEAVRRLGPVEEAKLTGYNLHAPVGTITLTTGGGEPSVVKFGGATYGASDKYAMGPDGAVFIVKADVINPFAHGANSLLERRVLPVENSEVTQVRISTPIISREVIQRFAEDPDKAHYADPAEPDVKLAEVSNWIDRVLKLRMVDLVEEKPSGEPRVKMELFGSKGPLGVIALWAPTDATAQLTSTFFDRTVTVSKANADAVLRQISDVVGESGD